MALAVQKLREIVFHLLYAHGFEPVGDEVVHFLMQYHHVTKKSIYKAQEMVQKFEGVHLEIDQLIETHSSEYEFDRIPKVEKNLLRLAIFEMIYSNDVPAKVAMSEAIRLTRKFATAEGARFVNAVLDAVYKTQPAC